MIEEELVEVMPVHSNVQKEVWDEQPDANLKRQVMVFRLPENGEIKSQIRRIVIEKNYGDDVLMSGVEVGTLTRLVLPGVLCVQISAKYYLKGSLLLQKWMNFWQNFKRGNGVISDPKQSISIIYLQLENAYTGINAQNLYLVL